VSKIKVNWEKILHEMEKEALKRKAPVLTMKVHVDTPFKALVFVLLSSRTKDETTAEVTKRLFSIADTPEGILKLPLKELESLIHPVGFYKVKARKLKELAGLLAKDYSSRVPSTFEELIKLPGIGRKGANVILSQVYGRPVIAVDTHVHRIANRLGVVNTNSPIETERELGKIIPDNLKSRVNKVFVAFGQVLCTPINPKCGECPLSDFCPKIGVENPNIRNRAQ